MHVGHNHHRVFVSWLILAGWLLGGSPTAKAQQYTVFPRQPHQGRQPQAGLTRNGNPRTTDVSFELLTGGNGAAQTAQEWARIFAKWNVPLRIRQPISDDKLEIKESLLGQIRSVTVVGQLKRSGTIVVPGRSFRLTDTAKLSRWIEELRTYGAQGSPEGQPLWGLNREQYHWVRQVLSEKLEADVQGLSLKTALAEFQLPPQLTLRFSRLASQQLEQSASARKVRQSLQGFSKGTALAIVLNNFGLAFRPVRVPDGSLQLTIVPLAKSQEAWPIGWPLEQSRLRTAPKLFQLVPVDLQDVVLKDVFDAISAKTEVPILIDYHRIDGQGIDIEQTKVSYPPRQVSWSQLIKGVLARHKLTRHILIDERGQPFVWITTLDLKRLRR